MPSAYSTKFGKLIHATAEEALNSKRLRRYLGKVDLVFTSPPFPLNRKKKYGNLQGQEYIKWLASLAPMLRKFLKPRG
jgi:DNA modification methylase